MQTQTQTLTVSRYDPSSRKFVVLGIFTIDGHGKVSEEYRDSRFEQQVRHGIRLGGRIFRPEDGPEFMHAVQKGFRSVSLFSVQAS
jgi:hypothetical protein